MKVRIRTGNRETTIPLPAGTNVLWLALRMGKVNLPHRDAKRLWSCLAEAKAYCGNWELVSVETASGEQIIVEI